MDQFSHSRDTLFFLNKPTFLNQAQEISFNECVLMVGNGMEENMKLVIESHCCPSSPALGQQSDSLPAVPSASSSFCFYSSLLYPPHSVVL